jgi:hypothetical protein
MKLPGSASLLVLLSLVASAALAQGCGSNNSTPVAPPQPGMTSTPGNDDSPTFARVNSEILQPKCVSCHSATRAEGGVDLSSYSAVTRRVSAGDPDGSNLYQQVASGHMPQEGTPLSTAQLQLMHDWIAAGAQNN